MSDLYTVVFHNNEIKTIRETRKNFIQLSRWIGQIWQAVPKKKQSFNLNITKFWSFQITEKTLLLNMYLFIFQEHKHVAPEESENSSRV